jgi:hypothetical protein
LVSVWRAGHEDWIAHPWRKANLPDEGLRGEGCSVSADEDGLFGGAVPGHEPENALGDFGHSLGAEDAFEDPLVEGIGVEDELVVGTVAIVPLDSDTEGFKVIIEGHANDFED